MFQKDKFPELLNRTTALQRTINNALLECKTAEMAAESFLDRLEVLEDRMIDGKNVNLIILHANYLQLAKEFSQTANQIEAISNTVAQLMRQTERQMFALRSYVTFVNNVTARSFQADIPVYFTPTFIKKTREDADRGIAALHNSLMNLEAYADLQLNYCGAFAEFGLALEGRRSSPAAAKAH